jgi:hypothetical protein
MLLVSSGITNASKATIIRIKIRYESTMETAFAGFLLFLKINLSRNFRIGTISILSINAINIPIQNGIRILPISATFPVMAATLSTANSTSPAKAIIRHDFFIL